MMVVMEAMKPATEERTVETADHISSDFVFALLECCLNGQAGYKTYSSPFKGSVFGI